MTTATLSEGINVGDAVKRGIDIVGAGAGLLLLLPVLAAIALVVRLDSPGPIFFKQQRPGRGMRSFTMIKFRTMVQDADRLKAEDFAALGYGPQDKAKGDPRITRVGRILRRFSLDELPQFINVLRGEMSIVGPRPLLGWELPQNDMMARSAVLPGVTGLWQVSGRSDLSFTEMLHLDLEYVRQRSIFLDLKIVLKTLPAMLSHRGAY